MKHKCFVWYIVLLILEIVLFCNVSGGKELSAFIHLMQVIIMLTLFFRGICNEKELFVHSVIHIGVTMVGAYICYFYTKEMNVSFVMGLLAIFLLFVSSLYMICAGVLFSKNVYIVWKLCVSVFVILVVSFAGLSLYWMTSGHAITSHFGNVLLKIFMGVAFIYGTFYGIIIGLSTWKKARIFDK